ncbi:hypothetical protein [Glutamicibacter sp. NPDC087344]|uniref:hypothetical protein n=1 Tax=Glutamicibacter sp. NPDC087344 TaxID=3363994 RepID=UPI0038017A15
MRPIEVPDFSFNSRLAQVVIAHERLRGDPGTSTTPPQVFAQLKQLFQLMASIMSARIEGNRTSIVEIVEGAQDNVAKAREKNPQPTPMVSKKSFSWRKLPSSLTSTCARETPLHTP